MWSPLRLITFYFLHLHWANVRQTSLGSLQKPSSFLAHQFVSELLLPTRAVINLWKCSALGNRLLSSLCCSRPLSPWSLYPKLLSITTNGTSSLPLHVLGLFKLLLYCGVRLIYSCMHPSQGALFVIFFSPLCALLETDVGHIDSDR